jgi:hypothetical protein
MPLRISRRLARLEEQAARAADNRWCRLCGDGPVRPIAVYVRQPDGTNRLVQGP